MASSNFLRVSLTLSAVLLAIAAVSCSSSPQPPDAAADPPGPPFFEDVTAKTGINFTYRNGEEIGHFAIIESLGGGVALFDFDNDGRIDIFFPGGGEFEGKTVVGRPGRFYRNLGDWKFEDATARLGLDGTYQYSHGAAAFDYDCDGWIDLLVTGYHRLVLFHNESDGQGGRRFVDATRKAGLHDTLWSTSAAWGDLDGDGFPELYVAHYGDWSFESNHPTDCTYDGKTRDVCQPRRFKALPHSVFRNNGNGTFTDISTTLKLRKDGKGMGCIMVDLDGDTRPDIYAANDTDDNFLYLNRSLGKQIALEEIGIAAGAAQDDHGVPNGSMGIDVADYDRSGRPSIIVSNYEGELPALYANRTNKGVPRFLYYTQPSGIAAIGGIYVGWGIGFIDLDQDGWQDLFMVNGHAIRFPTKIDRRQRPVLMKNTKGKFAEIARQGGAYFDLVHNARGLGFADLDNDGRVDCVISHLNEPAAMLRNVAMTTGRHWIGIELVGKKHRSLVGARVVIESAGGKQVRFIKGGGSFASTNDSREVIGLGSDASAKATVHWPSGEVQEFATLAADRYWKLTEGEAEAKPASRER